MKKFVLVLLVVLLVAACGSSEKESKPVVFVSIAPQKFFVEKIAGNKYDIKVMVQPGFSPADYEPLPSQMAQLSKAKMFFAIGVPFEKAWLKKIARQNPDMKIVHTNKNVPKRVMCEHHHHEGEAHDHGDTDPHIWLDPVLVKMQAVNIYDAIAAADSYNKVTYLNNLDSLGYALDYTHRKIAEFAAEKRSENFLIYHPVLGYFADRYGYKQHAIEQEGKEPSPSTLAKTIKFAKEHNISRILVQREFSKTSAEVIAKEIGGKVVEIDPLGEDYFNNLVSIAKALN